MEPIRVLHILHSMNRGGAENAIMNYYRNIDRAKVQFDFLLTNKEHCDFEDEIISLGGRVYRIPLITMTKPWPYLKAIKSFFKCHEEYKIVHSHTSSKSVFPLAVAKMCGIPVRLSHSHSSMAEPGLTGYIRKALRPFLKFVATDFLSCGNQAAVYLYGKKAFDQGKVKIFKNVIVADWYKLDLAKREEIRSKYGFPEDAIVLGHTARFHPVKNHLFDIEILSELRKKKVSAYLLLVGGGELENQIRNKAEQLGVIDYVIFAGIVTNVFDYEQAMDAFLLPSFNEGLPLSIIEAQVSGLPCFTRKDKVSPECSVTDLVHYLPLENGAGLWAERIIEACKNIRRDRWQDIAGAGYDAKTSAGSLQEFYIEKMSHIQ